MQTRPVSARERCPAGSRRRTSLLLVCWGAVLSLLLVQVGTVKWSQSTLTGAAASVPPPRMHAPGGGDAPDAKPSRGGTAVNTTIRLKSRVACRRRDADSGRITRRELDLQRQRRRLVEKAGGHPPGGYLAACVVVRNQHADLPLWLDYHRSLGVSRVYVYDDASDPPLAGALRPFVASGLVALRALPPVPAMRAQVAAATCHRPYVTHKQLMAYSLCLADHGAAHRWLAHIDVDEFFVMTDATPDLPTLLRGYEQHGGLAVNWRLFGSSGHASRQANPLRAYTRCFAPDNPENLLVKTIANTAFLARMAGPHDGAYAPGRFAVNAAGERVDGPVAARADFSRVALHHYATKSAADFAEKRARGDVMGDAGKLQGFWDRMEAGSVDNCTAGVEAMDRLRRRREAARKRRKQRDGER